MEILLMKQNSDVLMVFRHFWSLSPVPLGYMSSNYLALVGVWRRD